MIDTGSSKKWEATRIHTSCSSLRLTAPSQGNQSHYHRACIILKKDSLELGREDAVTRWGREAGSPGVRKIISFRKEMLITTGSLFWAERKFITNPDTTRDARVYDILQDGKVYTPEWGRLTDSSQLVSPALCSINSCWRWHQDLTQWPRYHFVTSRILLPLILLPCHCVTSPMTSAYQHVISAILLSCRNMMDVLEAVAMVPT